jgi:hypothetical protein
MKALLLALETKVILRNDLLWADFLVKTNLDKDEGVVKHQFF